LMVKRGLFINDKVVWIWFQTTSYYTY